MRSETLYFKKQEDMINALRFLIYYYDDKLRWADAGRWETEVVVVENQRAKEYPEPKIHQKRSEKSLGKRREDEQDQEGECSKFIQERKQEEERSFLEADNRKRYEKKEREPASRWEQEQDNSLGPTKLGEKNTSLRDSSLYGKSWIYRDN